MQSKKLQQAMKKIQRNAKEAISSKNKVLQQFKDREKKTKGLDRDIAQM